MTFTRNRLFHPLVITGTLVFAATVAAGDDDPPAQRWLSHARSCLEGVFSLEASFEQETIHSTGKRGPVSTGRLKLKRKGLMRIEYDEPEGTVMVCDGKTLTAWNPETKTIYETPAKQSAIWRAFAFILTDGPGENPQSRFLGGDDSPGDGQGHGVLEFRAPPRSTVSKILVTMRHSCPPVERVTVVDRAGTATRITLGDMETNAGMKSSLFSLPRPKGSKLVRP